MHWKSYSLALAVSAALLFLTPAAHAQTPLPLGHVAQVDRFPIVKTEYDRWLRIALLGRGQSPGRLTLEEARSLRDQIMQLLISSRWLEGEAALQGIAVTTAQVNSEFREQKRESFPKEREFRRFLRTSGQTIADVKWRVRIQVLSTRIRDRVVGDAKTAVGQGRRLDRFLGDYTARWRPKTVCGEGYDNAQDCGSIAPLSA